MKMAGISVLPRPALGRDQDERAKTTPYLAGHRVPSLEVQDLGPTSFRACLTSTVLQNERQKQPYHLGREKADGI